MSSIKNKLTAGILALASISGVAATQAQAGDHCHAPRRPVYVRQHYTPQHRIHPQPIAPIKLGLKGNLCHQGMQLVYVEPGSYAFQLGLRPGDILFAINRVKIHCAEDYFKGLHKAVYIDRGLLKIGMLRPNQFGQLQTAVVKASLHPQMIGPTGVVAAAPVAGLPAAGQPLQGAPVQGFQAQPGQQIPGQQFQGQPGQQVPGQQVPGQQLPPAAGQQVPGQQFQGQPGQVAGQQIPGQQQLGQPGQQLPAGQQIPAAAQQGGQNVQGFSVSQQIQQRSR